MMSMFGKRLLLCALGVLFVPVFSPCWGAAERLLTHGNAAFRIRSDNTAPLNADQGWAGELNESTTVFADQPFRIRFEIEGLESNRERQFRLQYRRNDGAWMYAEAHDFPHPERDIEIDFTEMEVGAKPENWRVVKGDSSAMRMDSERQFSGLKTLGYGSPLIAVYELPWDATEVTSTFRLDPDSLEGASFIVGYVDSKNYFRLSLEPAAGMIRVGRVREGKEVILAEKKASIPLGQWIDVEIEIEPETCTLEIEYLNESLKTDFSGLGAIKLIHSGFEVPANSAIEFQRFTFSGEARTPRVSIVSSQAYENGMLTQDILDGLNSPFCSGSGVSLADTTFNWNGGEVHGEFEWPVVIRRFADGAVTNNQGDRFEFRMIDAEGGISATEQNPILHLSIPPGHVGGTFVENPGRIGPWQSSKGDLYFIMEPTETDNVFMMIKSTDNGVSWQEVDGANRPKTDDLESVDSRLVGDTIHIIHQVTRSVRYHSFRTSDHPTHPDTWAVRDELAGEVNAIAQTASMAARSDGSIVAFFLGQRKIHYNIRSAEGAWGRLKTIVDEHDIGQAGPQVAVGKNDVVHLAYFCTDGNIRYRRFFPDGTISPSQQVAKGAGASRAEYGAVLPLVYNPDKDEVILIYRLSTGKLWERRMVNGAPPTEAIQVSDVNVVTDAVDSQQAGADAILAGGTVYVLFIDQASRSIMSTRDNAGWQPAKTLVTDISGSWVRGNLRTRKDGGKSYIYVYDAGSDGGSGMNRFGELVLH